MAHIYLGLGSNLGDRQANIEGAIEALKALNITVHKISTLIETDPVGGPPQGLFLNGVVHIETNLAPTDLLTQLKMIEKSLGRVKTIDNGPREIDLDILLYDDLHLNTPELTIPHPRMLERDFVLTPLKEIAPEIIKTIENANS